MFKVNMAKEPFKTEYVYFVYATPGDMPHVRGFETMRSGLGHFEKAYNDSIARGYGFSAGAILNWMYLRPRIFNYGTRETLIRLLGDVVFPEALRGTGVHETVFRCIDQEEAAKVYEAATPPHLTPAF